MGMMIHDARAPKKTCSICRQWYRPNTRVGPRQHACSKQECQQARRKKRQANWRARNPEYAAGYRIQQWAAQEEPPEPLRLPPPLSELPWDLAKDEFGAKGFDFIGVMGALLLRAAKDQFHAYLDDSAIVSSTLPVPVAKDPIPFAPYYRPMVEALLSRVRHHCHTVRIDGPSLREPQQQSRCHSFHWRNPRELRHAAPAASLRYETGSGTPASPGLPRTNSTIVGW